LETETHCAWFSRRERWAAQKKGPFV